MGSTLGGVKQAEESERGGVEQGQGKASPSLWRLMEHRDPGTLSVPSFSLSQGRDGWKGSWEADLILHYVFPLLHDLAWVLNRFCVSTLSPENWDQCGLSDFAFLRRKEEDISKPSPP